MVPRAELLISVWYLYLVWTVAVLMNMRGKRKSFLIKQRKSKIYIASSYRAAETWLEKQAKFEHVPGVAIFVFVTLYHKNHLVFSLLFCNLIGVPCCSPTPWIDVWRICKIGGVGWVEAGLGLGRCFRSDHMVGLTAKMFVEKETDSKFFYGFNETLYAW